MKITYAKGGLDEHWHTSRYSLCPADLAAQLRVSSPYFGYTFGGPITWLADQLYKQDDTWLDRYLMNIYVLTCKYLAVWYWEEKPVTLDTQSSVGSVFVLPSNVMLILVVLILSEVPITTTMDMLSINATEPAINFDILFSFVCNSEEI